MAKKNTQQPELLQETPADITPGQPGDPASVEAELIDDTPEKPKADLRKFNKAKAKVVAAINAVKEIVIKDEAGVVDMTKALKEAAEVGKLIEQKRKDLGEPYREQVTRINDCAKEIVKDLEPTIRVGKDKILAFHKEKEREAKEKRTIERDNLLKEIGFQYFQQGMMSAHGSNAVLAPYYFDEQTQMTIYRSIVEDAPDISWIDLLQNHSNKKIEILNQTCEALKQELEGAAFFGDNDRVAEITEKVQEVKAAPAPPVYSGGGYVAPKTRGLTKRWTFEVTDPTAIPREYLQLDTAKVRAAILAGTRTIAGIRIYQEESINLR